MEKREKRVPPKYGNFGGKEEKTRSIADFGFFCGFREGLQIMGRILNELILRNRGINGQFYDVFERNMRKEWFNNQVPGCFPEVDRLWTSR